MNRVCFASNFFSECEVQLLKERVLLQIKNLTFFDPKESEEKYFEL